MYITTFTVVPRPGTTSRFPLDMLRYDRCSPESQEDVARVADSLEAPANLPIVMVVRHGTKGDHHITHGRWESFGWVVRDVRTIRY